MEIKCEEKIFERKEEIEMTGFESLEHFIKLVDFDSFFAKVFHPLPTRQ